MKENPVGWFEIYVKDMERAKAFYENVFACHLDALPTSTPGITMYGFPRSAGVKGSGGALAKCESVEPGHNSTIVYFSSVDCANEERRIENAGGHVEKHKTAIGEYGFITLATDPEGNMFGIHSQA